MTNSFILRTNKHTILQLHLISPSSFKLHSSGVCLYLLFSFSILLLTIQSIKIWLHFHCSNQTAFAQVTNDLDITIPN